MINDFCITISKYNIVMIWPLGFDISCFILKFCHRAVKSFAFYFLSVIFPTLFAPYLRSIGNHHRYLSPCLKFYISLSVLFVMCLRFLFLSLSQSRSSYFQLFVGLYPFGFNNFFTFYSLICPCLLLIRFVSCILYFVLFEFGFWIFDQHITEASFLFLVSGSLLLTYQYSTVFNSMNMWMCVFMYYICYLKLNKKRSWLMQKWKISKTLHMDPY